MLDLLPNFTSQNSEIIFDNHCSLYTRVTFCFVPATNEDNRMVIEMFGNYFRVWASVSLVIDQANIKMIDFLFLFCTVFFFLCLPVGKPRCLQEIASGQMLPSLNIPWYTGYHLGQSAECRTHISTGHTDTPQHSSLTQGRLVINLNLNHFQFSSNHCIVLDGVTCSTSGQNVQQ